ncbi:phospholipid-binding protein MlaC [Actibacterium sp. XHP0104]|uniref:MlaC/ttg2D family ABC transporter substrate-binding protein n=1 Tax=Actibacterium sp. XHP0104 TaxID=2984335 RepID=UPI0021E6F23A|nr:ABC transporter substrate-binding protein [Actibacterium sp. XHP0104]MCV2881648.1 ABC transporter substrate-binding protein [Actibacterium sp. XHP0104]
MPSNLSRRFVLTAAAAAALAPALPAQALTTSQASALIDRVIADINAVINSGKSEAVMIREFERIFTTYADVPIIARSALGVAARSASSAQLNRFTEAFRGYMARKYGKRFREFIGGRLEVKGAKPVKSFYEVKTTAFLQGHSPFEVTFLVSDKSGRDLFFNMLIEGVNMLATERTEIGAMLDRNRGNVDALISDLQSAG